MSPLYPVGSIKLFQLNTTILIKRSLRFLSISRPNKRNLCSSSALRSRQNGIANNDDSNEDTRGNDGRNNEEKNAKFDKRKDRPKLPNKSFRYIEGEQISRSRSTTGKGHPSSYVELPWSSLQAHINKLGSLDTLEPVPALQIPHKPLFPGFFRFIVVNDQKLKKLIFELEQEERSYVAIFLSRKNCEPSIAASPDDVYEVGTVSIISSIHELSNGSISVGFFPISRARRSSMTFVESGKLKHYQKLAWKETGALNESIEDGKDLALVQLKSVALNDFDDHSLSLISITSEIDMIYQELLRLLKPDLHNIAATILNHIIKSEEFTNPANIADAAAALGSGQPEAFQSILSSNDIYDRLQNALIVLKNEYRSVSLQKKIILNIERRNANKNKEFWLKEQLKEIKKELGISSDAKELIIMKYQNRAANLTMPGTIKELFQEELTKFSGLESINSEYNLTKNYLDWITSIPWGINSQDEYDVNNACQIMNEDHYGLDEVKDRILEFIAVCKLKKSTSGKIICFVGPPGVGKTSMGRSIARALNRKFFRFSVGGLNDIVEIKGHRRTYVGALPGKIIQALRVSKTQNPLIMIDEIDKMTQNIHGNPASALLEVLDEEQNHSFVDYYLDAPIDLSNVLFICTANTTESIPSALLDRMEVITLSGYIFSEKMKIAEKYLIPRATDNAGLQDFDFKFQIGTLEKLIKFYCRESGVRNLKRLIDKVCRKSSLIIVKQLEDDRKLSSSKSFQNSGVKYEPEPSKVKQLNHLEITEQILSDMLGPAIYLSERLYDVLPIGVALGLAWTTLGGSIIHIEAILDRAVSESSTSKLQKTGKLGDIMKESIDLAFTYAKSFMALRYPENNFFEKAHIHLHCPSGAVSKDGPSAGITITTALLSLALNIPLSSYYAFTGELTLTGRVLKIGGLKEKVVAANRFGISSIFIPHDNLPEWQSLPQHIKEGITVIPIKWYEEVFDRLFVPKTELERSIKLMHYSKKSLVTSEIQPTV